MKKQLSESMGDSCPTEPGIWQRLQTSASKYGDKLAVASLPQPPDLYNVAINPSQHEYLRWTYKELQKAVDRCAASLQRLGVNPKTPLATFLGNQVEFIVISWAAHKLRCPLIPLNPRTLAYPEEVEHLIKTAKVTIVVLHDVEKCHLLDFPRYGVKTKIFISGPSPDESWTLFSALMRGISVLDTVEEREESSEPVAILFTSGTTSKPKGVPHTNTTINAFCQNLGLGGTSHEYIFCSVLPNNHAMGYFFPLHYMMHGGAVVFSGLSFDAPATLDALDSERITHIACVPTVLSALIEASESLETPFDSYLKDVCLSGASVTPENIRQVFTKLKSKGVSTGFGMTEGSPIWTHSRDNPENLIVGNSIISGSVSPGASVRICASDSRMPLPVGQIGEIHQTGPGTITSYFAAEEASDKFYQDEQGRTWFATGDQAVMHADERFSITGRYKDMIIRGGENISPIEIEAIISQHCNVQGYVVGVPDPIAGEVPVLVLRNQAIVSSSTIRGLVLEKLGPEFVPERILTLSELGLGEVPTTTSGKVQKSQLSAAARDCIARDENVPKVNSANEILDHLLAAYAKATSISVDYLDVNTQTSRFADSIAFMRVRDYLRKNTGHFLTAKEMFEHPTIMSQSKLLQERTSSQARQPAIESTSHGPPSLQELEASIGGSGQAQSLIIKVSKALEAKGFDWSRVSAVFPTHDCMQVLLDSHTIDTWNFSISIRTSTSTVQDLRTALQKTLPYHSILTSFVITNNDSKAYFVTLKGHDRLWDRCLLDVESVDTIEQVQQLAVNFPRPDLSTMPGPLFSCLLVHVKETDSAAMIMYLHHIVQDASSLRLFLEDLDQSLKDPTIILNPHTDFQAWEESYHFLRYSPAATKAVNYHVGRLRDLHKHKDALYPPARLPRQPNSGNPDGLDHMFDAPGLLCLKKENPKISAAVVLKAAMALVNVHRTGSSHSIFCNFEAGRDKFPFVPKSLRALAPDAFEASDVNGPVMQDVCNLIEVLRNETARLFLDRLYDEQIKLSNNSHAPLTRVIEDLNALGNSSGDVLVSTFNTQFMTWVPGMLGDYDRIQVDKIAIRCSAGLVVVASLGGPNATTYMMSARWDVANYSREETGAFIQDLEAAVLWLTSASNQDRSIAECIRSLGEA
ncbi:long chain fatty acid ligase [Fusarium heterosporum]|uniref:Long chain fatty acid ligase n=1 Tax=Fusarium heterosporum TaxID=42747 RepID=A0A8H5T3F9_FUSHE|nr:long chain fatty acid ligase [Fusarium heterosporum]